MHTSRRGFMWAASALTASTAPLTGLETASEEDASEVIQQNIDAKGFVELPGGTFRLEKPLVLDTAKVGYVGLRGAQGTTRLVMAGPGPALRVVGGHRGTADPGSVEEHTWERERFPVVSGVEIVGAHPEADGIEMVRTMQALITGTLIRKCRYGIHLVERNRNPVIAGNHIYECSDSGIFMDHVNLHQFIIIGNHISYCARAGIRQLNGDVHNVQVTGNDIEYNAGYEGMSGEILLEAPDSGLISEYTIASNTIQARPHHAGANIAILGREDDYTVGVVAITGNVLGSRDLNLLVENADRGLTVCGNTIYTGQQRNVILRRCERVVISGNTVTRSRRRDWTDLDGVLLEDCRACSLNGNIITGARPGSAESGGAVSLVRCRNVSVTGCQVLESAHAAISLEACSSCMVASNTASAEGAGAVPIRDSGGEENVISGNIEQATGTAGETNV